MFTALVVAGLMLLGVTVAARLGPKPDGSIIGVVAFFNGVCCLGLVCPPVMLGGLLTLLALAVWPPRPGRRLRFHLASMVAVGGGFAGVAFSAWMDMQEYDRLRGLYPFETLADRLQPRPGGTPPAFHASELEALEGQYDEREQYASQFSRREYLLRRLHEEQTELFHRNPKFGVARMLTEPPNSRNLGEPRLPEVTADPPLGLMVREDVRDFADPAAWGYRRGSQVAGFLPHALRRHPGPSTGWVVEKVELVGLLLAPDPRVYVSDELPRMTELAGAVTRHPDGFESPALARLRAGEELVLDEPVGRLLGAVRAAKQCLTCHGGDRGDLLGAFSYHLRRQSAP